jgi:hypothetical protein
LSVTIVTRLRLDAALHEPAPPYLGQGRPRRKGRRLPTPQQYLDAPQTTWTTVELRWYDGQRRSMAIASQTAVWFHYGLPAVPIRWRASGPGMGPKTWLCYGILLQICSNGRPRSKSALRPNACKLDGTIAICFAFYRARTRLPCIYPTFARLSTNLPL